jgi:hypothetical protein
MASVHTKRCSKCRVYLPVDSFQHNRSRPDGLQGQCRDCMNEANRRSAAKHKDRKSASNARWLEANRERKAAQVAAWRKANAERVKARNAAYREAHREELREKNRAYAEANKDKIRAKYADNPQPVKDRAKAWREKNPELAKAKSQQWKQSNPDRYREYMRIGAARRRARMSELRSFVILDRDLRRLLSSPCAVPGCMNTDIQIDHVIPVIRGGVDGVGNFQPLCKSHNASKSSRMWMEFRVHLAAKERGTA